VTAEGRYQIVLAASAACALTERLPAAAALAAYEFIRGPLAENPHRVGAPLRAPFEGLYRTRRGEYRVRYQIDDQNHRVVVLQLDHRRDAYRS